MIRTLAALAGCVALVAVSSSARAQTVQLEAKFFESWPGGWGGVSAPRAHALFGVFVGEHVLVLAGIGGGYGESRSSYSSTSETSLGFPVEVEVLPRALEVGLVAPMFRVGAAYALHRGTNRMEGNEAAWNGRGIGVLATFGVEYLATDAFGVVVDTGLRYSHSTRAYDRPGLGGLGGLAGLAGLTSDELEERSSGVDILGRIGLVLRL